jgi:methylated-DNA-[protein]-cysteine S-methyltransferase
MITASDQGVVAINWGAKGQKPTTSHHPVLRQAAQELGQYFAGKRTTFSVPIDATGTPFQTKVWRALTRIPYGETRSYADIARSVGAPQGYRAVGMANNRNPIPIIVPCHRVVGRDRSLTGYAGGLDIKEKLLRLEGIAVE